MEKYSCLRTYNSEDEELGVDFYSGKVYEYENGYMHSTENGTDIEIQEKELKQFWLKAESAFSRRREKNEQR